MLDDNSGNGDNTVWDSTVEALAESREDKALAFAYWVRDYLKTPNPDLDTLRMLTEDFFLEIDE